MVTHIYPLLPLAMPRLLYVFTGGGGKRQKAKGKRRAGVTGERGKQEESVGKARAERRVLDGFWVYR